MNTGRHLASTPFAPRDSVRDRGWVLLGTLLILSSLFTYVAVRPMSVFAVDPADPAHSTIVAGSLTPSVDSGTTITVTLRDMNDAVVVAADVVTISSNLKGTLTFTPNGDGTYSALLTDTLPRTHVISATVNGNAITTPSPTVVFQPGAVVGSTSTLTAVPGSPLSVDVGTTILTVQARDQYGNAIATSVGLVALSSDVSGALSVSDKLDGSYTASLADTIAPRDHHITGTIAAQTLTPATIGFTPGAANAGKTTISAVSLTPNVDVGSTMITVQAKDQFGNNLVAGGDVVEITSSLAGPLVSIYIGGGEYMATLADHVTRTHLITVKINGVTVTTGDPSIVFQPGVLHHFGWESVGATQVAGVSFPIKATAYDQYSNIKTDYTGTAAVLTSNLADAPNGTHPTPDPNHLPVDNLAWGSGTGVGTATVTAVQAVATTDRGFTITDDSGINSVTKLSGLFKVNPNTPASLKFSDNTVGFEGSPIDTKLSQPIYSVCTPGGVAPNPCATTPASTPVQVLVRDSLGNPVLPTTVAIKVDGAAGNLASGVSTVNGVAQFGNSLVVGSTSQGLKLKATATGGTAPTDTSNQFRIVDDITACQSTTCFNKSSSVNVRASYGKITATNGTFFGTGRNVSLTTQFVSNDQTKNMCVSSTNPSVKNSKPVGADATELRVVGLGVSDSGPTTSMLIIIPKSVLKASGVLSRGTGSFDVCLGAIYIGTSPTFTPWIGKNPAGSGTQSSVLVADSAPLGGLTRYWGVPQNCTATNRVTNPCISLRTKQKADIFARLGAEAAALMNDSDIAIIIEKPTIWDGKGGIY